MTSAIILAGGYGTRMRPLTNRRPKHLLPIGDRPVIAHQLATLTAAGVQDVVLATAYQAEAFRPVLGDGEDYGVRLRYAREPQPLGTGGALRNALATLFGEDLGDHHEGVVVLNGDLITEHDIAAQTRIHDPRTTDVTIHVRQVEDARAFGLVELHGEVITRFREKPTEPVAGCVNAGTYVVTPSAFGSVPRDTVVSLERDVFPTLVARGRMRAFREDRRFADIGTPASLLAENLLWSTHTGHPPVSAESIISPTAMVRESLVMSGAHIADGARITGCILGPGASVGTNAELTNCVLGDDAKVGSGVHLVDVILDEGERR